MQWFYFSVSNADPNITYHFNICNFAKPASLYNEGLQPCLYSSELAASQHLGWHRAGSRMCYFRGNKSKPHKHTEMWYTLSFDMQFPDSGLCYVAYGVPYTLFDLEQDVTRWGQSGYCEQHKLCTSMGGARVERLVVTDPVVEEASKAVIILSARVHPGETNSSWMMKGAVDWLTGASEEAALLRGRFVFHIVPMLNPDGVAVGNYRCSMAGLDLNRQWRTHACLAGNRV